jgi:hypothetical protein
MQQHVCMHDEENRRPERKEAEEWQVHVEEWQLDPTLQEKIAVSYAAYGYEKVKQDKEIAKPQTSTNGGRVSYSVAQCLEVLRLGSEGGDGGR